MTLKQLARILPGFVTMLVHSDNGGWHLSAGELLGRADFDKAQVVRAIPFTPYTMEVYVQFKEETK